MKNIKPKIIAIVGPTASGKTAIGVKLAKKFNGEIVSADSRQIFRGLDLGTGKEGTPQSGEIRNPNIEIRNKSKIQNIKNINKQLNPSTPLRADNLTIEQLRRNLRCIEDVPQWVIDVCDPSTSDRYGASPEEEFNLFKYTELAKMAILDILSRGKLPIIVGGTGLYVQALTEGFSLKSEIRNPKPETNSKFQSSQCVIPDLIRDPGLDSRLHGNDEQGSGNEKLSRKQLDNLTVEQLQIILKKIDPEIFEKLSDQKNPHRLMRAIERAQSGLEMIKVKPKWDFLQIAIDLPREILNKRIDKRVEDRFKAGMLSEAEELLKSGVSAEWLLKLGLEYRIIGNFVLNCHSEQAKRSEESFMIDPSATPQDDSKKNAWHYKEFESMKETLKLRSHQYAKRQVTWFKRFPEIVWLSNYKEIEKSVREFIN